MQANMLESIEQSMERQLAREEYPEGFPVLPAVPSARYASPDFASAEMNHLWMKTWLPAGFASELPEPGRYFLFDKLGQSIIINRGNDGVVRAFHNACRHRSSALVTEPRGKTKRYLCPYHAWNFALDGRLTAVPEMYDFACFDKSAYGLKPVRCETWRGMIFLNLDHEAGSLADFMGALTWQTAGFPFEDLIVKDHFLVEMGCNWKLAFHNFIEIYHLDMVHPTSLAPQLEKKSFIVSMLQNGHSRIAVQKKKGNSIYKSGVKPPTSVSDAFERFIIITPVFPNTSMAIDPSGFAVQTFWPDGPGKSVMDVRLVGLAESEPTDPEYWSAMRSAVDTILSEDLRLFSGIQRAVSSAAADEVLLSYQERAIYWFEEEIDRRIGAENIPAGMAVTPLLGQHIDAGSA